MINNLIITLFFISTLFSQGLSDYSFNTAESSSMAGSVVSNKGGDWSLYNNPSTIVEVDKKQFSFGYSQLYNQSYLPLSSFGFIVSKNIGFKYTSFKVDYSNIELLDESLFGLVLATYLLKDNNSTLSLGVSLNYYTIDFGRSSGVSGDGTDGFGSSSINALGMDIGFLASLRGKNRIGVFIKNINSPKIGRGISNQTLPRKIDIGFSTIPYDPLMISFSMEQLLGYPNPQFKTSIKYQINKMLCLNTGVQINPNRFGIGFVIRKNNISLSYGYITHHVLPGTHQSNIGFSF